MSSILDFFSFFKSEGVDILANNQNFPTGSIVLFPTYGTLDSLSTEWLLCNGSTYSTSTYSNLYNVIGNVYGGSGDSFNVPNLEGYVIKGTNTESELDTNEIVNQVESIDSNFVHNHSIATDVGSEFGGSAYNVNFRYQRTNVTTGNGGDQVISEQGYGSGSYNWDWTFGFTAGHSHSLTRTTTTSGSSNNTSGDSFSIYPSNIVMQYYIKV